MKNFDFFQKSFMVSLLMFLLLFIGSFFTDKTSDANQIFNAVYATGFCIMLFVSLGMTVLTFFRDKVENIGWESFEFYEQFNILKVLNVVCVFIFFPMATLTTIIIISTGVDEVSTWIDVTGILSLLFSYVTAIKGNWLIVKNNQDPAVIDFEKNRIKNLEAEML